MVFLEAFLLILSFFRLVLSWGRGRRVAPGQKDVLMLVFEGGSMATPKRHHAKRPSRSFWPPSPAERAFFDQGYMGYGVVLGAIAIFTIELTANALQGSGAMSLVHFLVIGPLYLFLILMLARALYRLARCRLGREQSRQESI